MKPSKFLGNSLKLVSESPGSWQPESLSILPLRYVLSSWPVPPCSYPLPGDWTGVAAAELDSLPPTSACPRLSYTEPADHLPRVLSSSDCSPAPKPTVTMSYPLSAHFTLL